MDLSSSPRHRPEHRQRLRPTGARRRPGAEAADVQQRQPSRAAPRSPSPPAAATARASIDRFLQRVRSRAPSTVAPVRLMSSARARAPGGRSASTPLRLRTASWERVHKARRSSVHVCVREAAAVKLWRVRRRWSRWSVLWGARRGPGRQSTAVNLHRKYGARPGPSARITKCPREVLSSGSMRAAGGDQSPKFGRNCPQTISTRGRI